MSLCVFYGRMGEGIKNQKRNMLLVAYVMKQYVVLYMS